MANDDKKEYKDLLLLLSHMGSGTSVLNKIDQLVFKMEDPRLRTATSKISQFFREQPEFAHIKKLRLLDYARSYSMNAGSRKQAFDWIFALQRYCQEHMALQVPQWQIIARSAGWTPPDAAGTPT